MKDSISYKLLLLLFLVVGVFQIDALAQIGLVVQLPPTANIQNVADQANGAVIDAFPESNQFLLSVPAVPQNLSDTDVRWMEVNSATTLQANRRPLYLHSAVNSQPEWYATQPPLTLLNLGAALRYATGRSIVIADINSQVDYSHPALIGHLTSGADFVAGKPNGVSALNDESSASYLDDESSASYLDSATTTYLTESSASYLDESSASYLDSLNPAYSHGTITAGILAAVAPNAMIMPLRAFDNNGESDIFMIAKAIRYAVNHGAQVINMSFGTPTDSRVLQTAIAYAISHGVTITSSAGNNNTSTPQFPAAYSGVIAAAGTTLADVKATFSNYGASIDIDAPGVNIIAPFPGNLYAIVNGTSFSAPIIAGTAALVRSMGVTDATTRINSSGVNIDPLNPTYAGQLGHGRIDILDAVTP
jgi:subtilisin family serine protease